MDATQVATDWWMDKQNICNGTLFSLKKRGKSDTCCHMDELWRHFAKWNKPVTKGQITYDSTYHKCQNNDGHIVGSKWMKELAHIFTTASHNKYSWKFCP